MRRVDLQATPSCSGLAAVPVCSCVDSGSLRDPADSTHCRCDTVVCTDTGFCFCSFESPPLPMLDKRCYLKMYICYYLENLKEAHDMMCSESKNCFVCRNVIVGSVFKFCLYLFQTTTLSYKQVSSG